MREREAKVSETVKSIKKKIRFLVICSRSLKLSIDKKGDLTNKHSEKFIYRHTLVNMIKQFFLN